MKPKPTIHSAQKEMFRVELAELVDLGHPLVTLGEKIEWAVFEESLGRTFDGKTGAPGIKTRLMVAAALPEVSVQHERRGGDGALGGESLLAAVQLPAVF
jgi:hypothetical protein